LVGARGVVYGNIITEGESFIRLSGESDPCSLEVLKYMITAYPLSFEVLARLYTSCKRLQALIEDRWTQYFGWFEIVAKIRQWPELNMTWFERFHSNTDQGRSLRLLALPARMHGEARFSASLSSLGIWQRFLLGERYYFAVDQLLDLAVRLFPDAAQGYYLKAESLLWRGNAEEALSFAKRARLLAKDGVERIYATVTCCEIQNSQEALRVLTDAVPGKEDEVDEFHSLRLRIRALRRLPLTRPLSLPNQLEQSYEYAVVARAGFVSQYAPRGPLACFLVLENLPMQLLRGDMSVGTEWRQVPDSCAECLQTLFKCLAMSLKPGPDDQIPFDTPVAQCLAELVYLLPTYLSRIEVPKLKALFTDRYPPGRVLLSRSDQPEELAAYCAELEPFRDVSPVFRLAYARALSSLERFQDVSDTFATVPELTSFPSFANLLAEACFALGQSQRSRELYAGTENSTKTRNQKGQFAVLLMESRDEAANLLWPYWIFHPLQEMNPFRRRALDAYLGLNPRDSTAVLNLALIDVGAALLHVPETPSRARLGH
jgi:tetratricopeptide (TPR) repeat protein